MSLDACAACRSDKSGRGRGALSLSEVLVSLGAYLLPMLLFFYMGLDVLYRNPKKIEHQLVSLIIACYFILFMEEYVRFLLPIEYSPALTALWFSNVGIAIPGIGVHFISKFSGMDKRLPRFIYPYIFYIPLLVIPFNMFSNQKYISSQEFVQVGIWKYPVYNFPYFAAMTGSILIAIVYLVFLLLGQARVRATQDRERAPIYRLMIAGTIITMLWVVFFGYFQFENTLPPYSYLYGGLVWCFMLRLAMQRFEFLNSNKQRYERLFNLNPAAILLVESSGTIKEANPSAKQMFDHLQLEHAGLDALASTELKKRLRNQLEIKELEAKIHNGERELTVLIDGDYITVDNEPHVILIFRNITLIKEHQEQIAFLAYHDALTELPNRRFFYERLAAAIAEAERKQQQLAVVLIDLDEFKETNDRFGHDAGDALLRHTAGIIKESVGGQGMAARLGGDEFVLFISPLPAADCVYEIIPEIEERFASRSLHYGNEQLFAKLSMGISLYPRDGLDGDSLLNSADKAMYKLKRERKLRKHNVDQLPQSQSIL